MYFKYYNWELGDWEIDWDSESPDQCIAFEVSYERCMAFWSPQSDDHLIFQNWCFI